MSGRLVCGGLSALGFGSEAGNTPAPSQKKWLDLFYKREKCPVQVHDQSKLSGGPQKRLCGFHPPKVFISDFQVVSVPPAASVPPALLHSYCCSAPYLHPHIIQPALLCHLRRPLYVIIIIIMFKFIIYNMCLYSLDFKVHLLHPVLHLHPVLLFLPVLLL
ncbi:hypothetical protein HF521_016867 [Silurus meridionalis]|uniref:Uncharacterized protein n=1 Tax=Silurus meridionalis TaxID=175797 RepID=A0A8T0BR32_SILME|nr:hypothetical protein HF521_016867 [Silurus meridionalis]